MHHPLLPSRHLPAKPQHPAPVLPLLYVKTHMPFITPCSGLRPQREVRGWIHVLRQRCAPLQRSLLPQRTYLHGRALLPPRQQVVRRQRVFPGLGLLQHCDGGPCGTNRACDSSDRRPGVLHAREPFVRGVVLPWERIVPQRAVCTARQYVVWSECGLYRWTAVHRQYYVLRTQLGAVRGAVLRERCAVHQQPLREAGRKCVRTHRSDMPSRQGVHYERPAVCGRWRDDFLVVNRSVLLAGAAAVWDCMLQRGSYTQLCVGWGCAAVRCSRQQCMRGPDMRCKPALC